MSEQVRRDVRRFWARNAVLIALGTIGAIGAITPSASSEDRNFAGSAQLSYLYAPSAEEQRGSAMDGFVLEANLKLTIDFDDHVSGAVKVCYGCHGFEMGMAYMDIVPIDQIAFRVGRFNPTFGEFGIRHDPANHRTVDKPLPYDMGRMLRLREWNLGILPQPYVDNGVEVSGTHWFGDSAQLSYAAHVVAGLRAEEEALDFDFTQSRSLYYLDNNSRPAVGGRLGITLDLSDGVSTTLGFSGMHGTYDPDNELTYTILGADLFLNVGNVDIRAEYLIRRNDIGLGDQPQDRFRYGPGEDGRYEDFFLKDGFYVEAYTPVVDWLDLVLRFDGLRRFGNVATTSPLRSESAVLRYTLGLQFIPSQVVTLKLSGEIYDFSDFEDEFAVTGAVVGML